jgi:hypothetical protein
MASKETQSSPSIRSKLVDIAHRCFPIHRQKKFLKFVPLLVYAFIIETNIDGIRLYSSVANNYAQRHEEFDIHLPLSAQNVSFPLSPTANVTTQPANWSTARYQLFVPFLPNKREPIPRPSYRSLVRRRTKQIVGTVDWLLNFAVIGFPKTGTSTMMRHLASHPEAQVWTKETCTLMLENPHSLVHALYHNYTSGPGFLRGLKCPRGMEDVTTVQHLAHRFAATKVIVGVRHPVHYFESFYNFRVQNGYNMIPPSQLIGACGPESNGVCTDRANFHYYLARMNKTPLGRKERTLTPLNQLPFTEMHNVTAPVFLYEVSQLSDSNQTRSAMLRKDLQNFLGMLDEIPSFPWVKPGRKRDDHSQRLLDAKKINICDAEHKMLRVVLMGQSWRAATWMRHFFLSAPNVFVSSPEYFIKSILSKWFVDPCTNETYPLREAPKEWKRARNHTANDEISRDGTHPVIIVENGAKVNASDQRSMSKAS